jgi:hypothetical protein
LPAWLCQPESSGGAKRLEPHEIAPLYRALRKGREDSRDEPGAADFYYGEMEMRRQKPGADREWNAQQDEGSDVLRTPAAERVVLWAYWLVSGYSLRASRALAGLLVIVIVFSVCFWWFGFTPRPDYARALLFSIESTSSLFRAPETPNLALTYGGEALQVLLRLLGPLFFGLALLSLRGRVKR